MVTIRWQKPLLTARMTNIMAEEIVDIIDGNGEVLRQAVKSETHQHGWLHKTVIGYLRDGDEWILVRQAADRQDAGQLVAPVGGHVQAGESETDALLRESEEEIGTRNIEYKLIGRAIFHRQVIGRDENHLFVVYEIYTDDEIVLNEESVSYERFTHEGLMKALVEFPENFGDAYYFVLEKFYPDYLPVTWENRYE
jgi:8-oxo-dGTP pyrophosphatase MutT (NUDIX family)